MALQEIVEQTVTGLGYELVEIERSVGGLLRITIDFPYQPATDSAPAFEQFVTVEDCEKVNRQLQYLLEVEGIDYRRLEIGSPGIDRPLRGEGDYLRFTGHVLDLALKQPIGPNGAGISPGRKKFRGTLERADDGLHWQLVWSDEPPPKPGQRVSKKRPAALMQVLGFELHDVQQARLAPIVNFKGRRPSSEPAPLAPDSAQPSTSIEQDNRKGGEAE